MSMNLRESNVDYGNEWARKMFLVFGSRRYLK